MTIGLAACQIYPEDAFSNLPAAPELAAHSNILMTANTMDEDVVFSWTKARFMSADPTYILCMVYNGQTEILGTTDKLFFSLSKTEFKAALYEAFPDLPQNSKFTISFCVDAVTEYAKTESAFQTISIYAFGDAVSPVLNAAAEAIVLDVADPTATISLLDWEEARLAYNEDITYSVFARVGENSYKVKEGIGGTSFSLTTDELNEAVIAAGGAEAEPVEVFFYVVATSATYADGVASNEVKVIVTTYVSSFPEILYIPGSHQGWDPATAPTLKQSTAKKGFYEGVINLTTADASDAQFKFCPEPAWGNDFGGVVTLNADYTVASAAKGTVGVSDNIVVPSGIYNIALNKKLNTIELVQVKSLSLIGEAIGGWDKDIALEYDAEAQTFSAVCDLVAGGFKVRFNNDWTYSMGGTVANVSSTVGDNIDCTVTGNYKVVLNVAAAPYTIKFINTSFPENIYLPGTHNGWNASTKFNGDGEGHYEGFAKLGGEWGFKLTKAANGSDVDWGTKLVWDKVDGVANADGSVTYGFKEPADGEDDNFPVAEAYYKAVIDMTAMTMTLTEVKTVEICGGMNSWGVSEDYMLKYDPAADSWKIEDVAMEKGQEWKFRMNDDTGWAVNLGGELSNLVHGGNNIACAETGIYTIELKIATTPYTATVTKTGDLVITLPEEMYLIGEGVGGWTFPTNAVAMIPVNGVSGGFWAIRYIEAGKGFKFSKVNTDWGQDFAGLDNNDGFSIDGGNCSVAATGLYMINVDYAKSTVKVEPAKVYGIGDCFGGWNADMASALFTVNPDGTVTSPALAAGNVRIYAASSCFSSDWWTREFRVADGKIDYRGKGGDQASVAATAGQKVTLDFNAGTGKIE